MLGRTGRTAKGKHRMKISFIFNQDELAQLCQLFMAKAAGNLDSDDMKAAVCIKKLIDKTVAIHTWKKRFDDHFAAGNETLTQGDVAMFFSDLTRADMGQVTVNEAPQPADGQGKRR